MIMCRGSGNSHNALEGWWAEGGGADPTSLLTFLRGGFCAGPEPYPFVIMSQTVGPPGTWEFLSSKIIFPAKSSFRGNFLPFCPDGLLGNLTFYYFMILSQNSKIHWNLEMSFQQNYLSGGYTFPWELPSILPEGSKLSGA